MKFLKIFSLAGLLLLLALATAICTLADNSTAQSAKVTDPEMTAQLQAHVTALCEQPRYGPSLEHARRYIEQHLRAAGWQLSKQYFETTDGEKHCNICALRRGRSGKRYIIGAHYDACDTGEGPNPGADDNASALAALLVLAESLPEGESYHDIQLVAWACEEPPWFDSDDMGSAHHAAACPAENVIGVICLEMLGYYSDAPESQPSLFPGYSLLLPTVGNFVAVVGNLEAQSLAKEIHTELKQDMPAVRLNIPWASKTELFFSDHRNYHPLGIPAVMVTDTAMLRNPNYHKPTDTPDTLDYERLTRVTQGLIRTVSRLTQTEK